MRRILGWIVVAAAIVAGAWWLMGLPGRVSARINDTAIAAPTPVFILAVLALFFIVYAIIRLIGAALRLPRNLRRRREQSRRRDGDAAVTRTLVALASGDGTAAERHAQRSRRLLGDTPQTLLLAAYAGRLSGKTADADAAFQLLAERKDAAFLGYRGLLQKAIANENWAGAADIARRAEQASPGAPWLRAERAQLAIHAGSWREALSLSGPGGPVAALATAAAEDEPNGAEARKLAKQAWDADPTLTPAALAYARQLRAAGKETRAQEVLRSTWSMAPHPDIASFALATARDDLTRTRQAEALAKAAPKHFESSFLLARVALEAGLTGEAQRYAQAARDQGMNQRRLWLLQAEIAGRTADVATLGDALRHAANAEPDPVWRCAQCGTSHTAWRPVCDSCQTPGRIMWATGAPDGHVARLGHTPLSDGVLT